jgi:hypothetical protein
MFRKIMIATTVLLLVLMVDGCSNNEDVEVIQVQSESLTWGEVKETAENYIRMHPAHEEEGHYEAFMDDVYNLLIVPMVIAMEMEKRYTQQESIQRHMKKYYNASLAKAAAENIVEFMTFSDTAYKIFYITVQPSDPETTVSMNEAARVLAGNILDDVSKIKDNEKFMAVLSGYAQETDFSIRYDVMEYFLATDAPGDVGSVLESLKKNRYHDEPINVFDDSYMLIYLIDKKTVTHKNIDSIKDPAARDAILSQKKEAYFTSFIQNLGDSSVITRNFEGLESDDPATVLLAIEPNFELTLDEFRFLYTQDNLPDRARKYFTSTFPMPADDTLEDRVNFLHGYTETALLINYALQYGLEQGKYFNSLFKETKIEFYNQVFRLEVGEQRFGVTDAEARQWYEDKKDPDFIEWAHFEKTGEKIFTPFTVIESKIRMDVMSDKYESYSREKINEFIGGYEIVYNDELLRKFFLDTGQ